MFVSSSSGKEIVAFLGNTASGKSTVINYICRKELIMDDSYNIILKCPNDPEAMKIGNTSSSETTLPKFIKLNDLILYDFPGFADNRGVLSNLLNACFIKNILENAASVRLVLVIGQDEITAKKEKSLKNSTLLSRILFQMNILLKLAQ